MSLYETYLSKSKEYLINEMFKSWERNQKLYHQLKIQTKRVENLKKSNEFYAYDENYNESEECLFDKVMGDSEIKDYSYGLGQFKVAGKLARSCQVIDQELEKELKEIEG